MPGGSDLGLGLTGRVMVSSQKNGNQLSLSFMSRISAMCSSFMYVSSHLGINKMIKVKFDPRYYTMILRQQDILTVTC
jgi:hypothetical protein